MSLYFSALKLNRNSDDYVQKKVIKTEKGNSVAFEYDIISGELPEEYNRCDILYAELPWVHGLPIFDLKSEIESKRDYVSFITATSKIIKSVSIPVVIIVGIKAKRYLPICDPYDIIMSVNSGKAKAYCYNFIPPDFKTTEDLITELSKIYSCIGDFCCGYGNSGRIFKLNGKEFVMSDYNAKCIGYIDENL